MTVSLRGRTALVTGAGRGIGAAHAHALANAGAAVLVNDNGVDLAGRGSDPDVADRCVAAIRSAGGAALADHSDVSDFAGAACAVQRAIDEFGGIDIVINNAGIIGTSTDVASLSEDELQRVLAVHVVGTIGTIKAALPSMRSRGHGRILNTISEAALATDLAAGIAYAAAKSAVWGITMAAAQESAGTGVTVNAISPGALTRMSAPYLEKTGIPDSLDLSPGQIARVALVLCSDDARDVNGKVVHTAAGFVREYVLNRVDDSALVRDLVGAIDGA